MDQRFFAEVSAWLAQAGLAGMPEADIIDGYCERCVSARLPLDRGQLIIDTLHPVHEGRLFRWGQRPEDRTQIDYGRTSLSTTSPEGVDSERAQAAARWRASPFYHLLQTGETLLRRRLDQDANLDFAALPEMRDAGMTDYVAIINRFPAAGVIGEMDGVYSSWATAQSNGFTDDHIRALERTVPFLSLAIKTLSLTRMTGALLETYLGRDAGRRVLSGRIERGVADRIDAVIWFSDLAGFTRITDTAPKQVIPLLNDYADVIVSAVHEHGGDVLKLIGDGTLAIFTADERGRACSSALDATIVARRGIVELNKRRAAAGLPVTDMYLGLHVGEVFYGNVGSRERLDFTVIGPAVNEASRIAAMCRSVDQPLLVSPAFAAVGDMRRRLVSVGRYALRGVSAPQELFTLDPEA
jgi:adenylate cyclase